MEQFIELDKLKLKELMKGGFAGFIQTENLTVAYTDMKPGVEIPLHFHPEEAIDIVLEGELEMQIGDMNSVLKQGMITIVPGNVPHRAVAITECKVITIFYPQRKL
jgi:quercetin dioxygenase-like cupin family protein